jgi:hypothetical protein
MRKRTARRKVRRAKTRRGGAGNNNDPSYNASSRMYGGPAPIVNEPNVSSRMYGGPVPIVNEPNVSSRMYGGPAPIVNAVPNVPNANRSVEAPNVPIANHAPSYTNSSSNMGTQANSASSYNMGTHSDRASSSNMETQTNNNTRNITNMTEDQLLQQYSSVYETISSKADAVESTALFKKHLQTIQNPIAIYIVANMDSRNDGYEIYKNATLNASVITRIGVHSFHSTFKGWPLRSAYPSERVHLQEERMKALGYLRDGNINTLYPPSVRQFKTPLDSRLIRMFQSISKSPAIGQTNTITPSMPMCQSCTTGCHVTDMRVFQGLINALI